ncbi:MAG: hypothetical protein AABY22_30765, partial [Nanoarchaeota archaeon]
MPKIKYPMTDRKEKLICQAYCDEMPCKTLLRYFHIQRKSLLYILNKYCISIRPLGFLLSTKLKNYQIKEIIKLYNNGMSLFKIAGKYHINDKKLQYILKKFKVKVRNKILILTQKFPRKIINN